MSRAHGAETWAIDIEGIPKAEEFLLELETTGTRRILQRVMKPAAAILKAAIKFEAPTGPNRKTGKYAHKGGRMKSQVKYKAIRRSYGLGYMVGPFGKGTAQRHLVTAGHALSNGGRTRANPFVSRGFALGWGTAESTIDANLQAALDAEIMGHGGNLEGVEG